MRGRLAGTAPVPGNVTDLGRPTTFGATTWLEVEPRGEPGRRRARLSRARRGRRRRSRSRIRLKDPHGAPLAGEVTLWLVDQAVLALAREARLDPLPNFISAVARLRGARHALDGRRLPAVRRAPGRRHGEEGRNLLDRPTVRKNFKTVPYFNPSIVVGPDGVAGCG